MLEGSILQKLEANHRHSKRPIRFGVYFKNTLVSLCHALEDYILNDKSGQALVITAFQKGKWYLQEAERYADITKKAQHVLIMAAPDSGWAEHPTSQLPNLDLLALDPSDPVSEEWHLIILSPDYTAMVLCQELSASDYGVAGIPQHDLERKFYGLWTFEPELVKETAEIAISHVNSYNPELGQKLLEYHNAIQPHLAAPEDLNAIVSLVVDYLQTGQKNTQVQLLDNNLLSNEIQAFLRMAQIMDAADITNPMAASEVVALAETMGQLLDLPAWQIKRLRLAALLHRIDPLQRAESVLANTNFHRYQEDAPSTPLTCPLIPGAQVLRTMPRLRAIAQIITHQTEWWNGTGDPAGLAGNEIPLESRILALLSDFQARVNQKKSAGNISSQDVFTQSLEECRLQQSTRFDPKLIEALTLLVMGLQQGLEIGMVTPKTSAGMWLLDHRLESENKISQEIGSRK
ncbi:putative sensor protein [Calothrix sp. NIES-4071]|nr:putative sensor protein [Calothrix sp. NIES-4071]BAZ61684.1 putative sensor protein [Calothrix sp. NIES-4105]